WSPTDNLDKLQAAVVNEDTGAEKPDSDGETLHAGDELVDEITPEGEGGFDWEETSQEEADEGLAEGKYFAVLEIPSNFSERLVSTGATTRSRQGCSCAPMTPTTSSSAKWPEPCSPRSNRA